MSFLYTLSDSTTDNGLWGKKLPSSTCCSTNRKTATILDRNAVKTRKNATLDNGSWTNILLFGEQVVVCYNN